MKSAVKNNNNCWTCLYCLVENELSAISCQVCHYTRPVEVPREVRTLQRSISRTTMLWICPRCTYSNGFNIKVCKTCRHPIPKESIIPVTPNRDPRRDLRLPALPWEDPTTFVNHTVSSNLEPCRPRYTGRKSGGVVNTDVFRSSCLLPNWPLAKSDPSLKDGRKKALKIYKNAIEVLQLTGGLFVDPDFLPDSHSMYYEPNETYSDVKASKHIQWLRPRHITSKFTNQWTVFGDGGVPLATDINQGAMGIGWFMSALSILLETPELLENVLLTRDVCQEGVYLVSLCKDGRWAPLMLDDTFPCDRHGRMQSCQGKQNQLWVSVVEKAAAKLFGCYEALSYGTFYYGFSLLTGAPCHFIRIPELGADNSNLPDCCSDPEFIWTRLCYCQSAGFPVGIRSGRKNCSQEKYKASGLVTNQMYSLVNTWENNGLRLIQLKNPWGQSGWNGDWCDKSALWSEHIRSVLSYHTTTTHKTAPNQQTNGIFWMSYEHFIRYFSEINICDIQPNWTEIRTEGILPSENYRIEAWLMKKIVVEAETDLTLTLYQDSQRHAPEDQRSLRDLCVMVLAMRGDVLDTLVLCSARTISESISCSGKLDAGTFIVACISFNQWSNSQSVDDEVNPLCVLAIHSAKSIRFDTKFKSTGDMFLETIFLFATNDSSSQSLTEDDVTVSYVMDTMLGAIAVTVNRSEDKMATVKFDFGESRNVLSTRNQLCTEDAIPPGRRQVLNIITRADCKLECQVQLNSSLYISPWLRERGRGNRKLSKDVIQLHGLRPVI